MLKGRKIKSKPKNTHRHEGLPVFIAPQDTSWTSNVYCATLKEECVN